MNSAERRLVRIDFAAEDGIAESGWAEHVHGNVYRSTTQHFSNVTLRLPADHEHAAKNGQPCCMAEGHVFEAEVIRPGWVRPRYIIGWAETAADAAIQFPAS